MSALQIHRLRAVLCAGFAFLMPGISAACSVCMTGRDDETRLAFVLMTAFMTVMPFVLAGWVFYWIRGHVRNLEAMHDRAREASAEDLLGDESRQSSIALQGVAVEAARR